MDNKQKILNYWYNLEFFAPFWPQKTKDTLYVSPLNTRVPWSIKDDARYSYDIYIGRITSQDLIEDMLSAIEQKDEFIERDNSVACVCAFKLKADGTYVENSFSVSTFVWALAKIIAEKNLKVDLDKAEINKLNNEINGILLSIQSKFEYEDLEKIYRIVLDRISLNINNIFSAAISKKQAKKRSEQETEESDIGTSTDMLSSFFISDIDKVRREIQSGDSIVKYIEALSTSRANRIQIDTDITQMKRWLSPEKYPLGKWPSIYSPSLMQQVAINIGLSDKELVGDVFSINGPPGTGKTTLLKEIIASYVVERAVLLSQYSPDADLDNHFKRCEFDNPPNEYLKHYYKLPDELKIYGIIVASNNNAAVENISKELPIAKGVEKSNTQWFNADTNEENYFADIAKVLMGNEEECWGLISACLGKQSNINKLKQALWFEKEVKNLQQLYKEERPNWKEAKKKFETKYQEVLECRKEIQKAVEDTNKHDLVTRKYEKAKNKRDTARDEMVKQQNLLNEAVMEQENLKNQMEVLDKNVALFNSRLSLFKKIFSFLFYKDPIILELKKTQQKINLIITEQAEKNKHINDLQGAIRTKAVEHEKAQEEYEKEEKDFLKSRKQMKRHREQFGNNLADEAFWKDIQENENSQAACAWTYKEYDALREELFYYGLMLHKAFVLNSKKVKHNMNCLVNMWNGQFTQKDHRKGYTELLNTLFLIVPVVSTTFASVATFLKYVDKKGLGTLIIDEAGQATPWSALGALWRTRKAIIVGDPLQVEPVVTVPKALLQKFADTFEIGAEYRKQELSVQMLADSINPYGGLRKRNEDEIWLGCPLVIHRRCLDPMFSISNKIAYDNRMFQKSVEPEPEVSLLLSQSVWIDIKGKEEGGKDHFVPAQGDKAVEMVLSAFELQKGFPNLYIISPFKTVANGVKSLLKKELHKHYTNYNQNEIDYWVEKSCGTVHTFQGKEANEVIIILGCGGETGEPAVQWAGKKPNILNVAMTRAKYRVAMIGDSDVWCRMGDFDVAYEMLDKI